MATKAEKNKFPGRIGNTQRSPVQDNQITLDANLKSSNIIEITTNKSSNHILWIVALLGVWIILLPFTFSTDFIAIPSGGRTLWLTNEERKLYTTYNDISCGIIVVIAGILAVLNSKLKYLLWICCFIGAWLTISPLLFWAPSPASYINDTLVGALLIALTSLTGQLPGLEKENGFLIPDGWTYNPSAYSQRWPLMIAGFAGWMLSRYLSAYQLGYIPYAVDPFFGNSTIKVLNSSVSLSLPVSDGGIGAVAYTFEFLIGMMGGESRWRTKPWLVFLFGLIIIPVGFAHVFLVVSQPVVVGYWCTFCLLAACCMLAIIVTGADEIFASVQLLVDKKREGNNWKKVFWKGDTITSINNEDREENKFFPYSVKGASSTVSSWLSMFTGVLIAALPALFKVESHSAVFDFLALAGLLIVAFSVLSMSELFRKMRWINIAIAFIFAAGIWFMHAAFLLKAICLIAGLLVIVLSLLKRDNNQQYGFWERYI